MIPRRLTQLERDLRATNDEVRRAALQELTQYRHSHAIELLFALSQSPADPLHDSARPAFEQSVAANPDIALRLASQELKQEAIRVTGLRRVVKAVPDLARILSGDGDVPARCAAAESLGSIATAECVGPLCMGENEPVLELRRACLEALRNIRSGRAEAALVGFLHDDNWNLRKAAHESLLSGGWKPFAPRELVATAIVAGRFDEAIRHGEDSIELLCRTTTQCDESEVRHWAAVALAQIKSPRVLQRLMQLRKSSSESVRTQAIAAITVITGRSDVTPPEPDSPPAASERRRESIFHLALRMLGIIGEP